MVLFLALHLIAELQSSEISTTAVTAHITFSAFYLDFIRIFNCSLAHLQSTNGVIWRCSILLGTPTDIYRGNMLIQMYFLYAILVSGSDYVANSTNISIYQDSINQ